MSCNVVVVGERGVGKTALVNRFINDSFTKVQDLNSHGYDKKSVKKMKDAYLLNLKRYDCCLKDIFLLLAGLLRVKDAKPLQAAQCWLSESSLQCVRHPG